MLDDSRTKRQTVSQFLLICRCLCISSPADSAEDEWKDAQQAVRCVFNYLLPQYYREGMRREAQKLKENDPDAFSMLDKILEKQENNQPKSGLLHKLFGSPRKPQ